MGPHDMVVNKGSSTTINRLQLPNMMRVRGALVKRNYRETMSDEMLRSFVEKTVGGDEG